MRFPLRSARAAQARVLVLCAALAGTTLTGCSALPEPTRPLDLGSQPQTVGLSQGRVTVVVVDELGLNLPNTKVELSWQEPSFYRTIAFTNRFGEVTFSGVPSIAEIRIDHQNGDYVRTLVVPQTGRPELRVMLDTMGEAQMLRERERTRTSVR